MKFSRNVEVKEAPIKFSDVLKSLEDQRTTSIRQLSSSILLSESLFLIVCPVTQNTNIG